MTEKLSDRVQETINRNSILSYFYVTSNLIPDIKALEVEHDKLKKMLEEANRLNGMASPHFYSGKYFCPKCGYEHVVETHWGPQSDMFCRGCGYSVHDKEFPIIPPKRRQYFKRALNIRFAEFIDDVDKELLKKAESAESRLTEAEKLADKLCNSQPDPYDDAYSDAAPWLTMRRQIGRELKKALGVGGDEK